MLIIEGPNEKLRSLLIKALELRLGDEFGQHISGFSDKRDLKWICSLVMCDHRKVIYNGFPRIDKFTAGQRHMIKHALAASGSMVVFCAEPNNLDFGHWKPEVTGMYCYILSSAEHLKVHIDHIVGLWRESSCSAWSLWEFGSTGGFSPDAIMLIGDRVNPFIPLDVSRRQAFVSHHGSSHWLHGALAETGRSNYYITNAHKVADSSANCIMLTDEIMRLNPKRIIAMGDEAAAYMSELDAPFVRTYHPQYWSRFKRSHTLEFLKLLNLSTIC